MLKNLGNLKAAVMKGASKIQEACKDLLVECKNVRFDESRASAVAPRRFHVSHLKNEILRKIISFANFM